MVSLSFPRLVNPRVRICARSSHVPHVAQDMTLRVLHPQRTQVTTYDQKRNRGLMFTPPLNREAFNENEAAPIEHLVKKTLQSWRKSWKFG